MPINVTVWNEFRHEKESEQIKKVYPNGIHNAIADFLKENEDFNVRTAVLDDPECGLTDEVLDWTDVLIWWGHEAHQEVPDIIAEKVQQSVLKGMGFIPLHSAHFSKPFMRLMGTSCTLRWRDGDKERIWVCAPSHPIANGISEYFELPVEEMYGEYFDIPKPDETVFIGWFSGGEVFRSGCTFTRGHGKIFYFQPGHEANPTYYNENIRKILVNAVNWAAPTSKVKIIECIAAGIPPEKK